MKILQLDSGLFPDHESVRVAIHVLENAEHTISRVDVGQLAANDDAGWDAVVREVLTADQVVTV